MDNIILILMIFLLFSSWKTLIGIHERCINAYKTKGEVDKRFMLTTESSCLLLFAVIITFTYIGNLETSTILDLGVFLLFIGGTLILDWKYKLLIYPDIKKKLEPFYVLSYSITFILSVMFVSNFVVLLIMAKNMYM